MRDNTIARNYAEALLVLATKADNREGYGAMIRDVGQAVSNDKTLYAFLDSPRVTADEKNAVLSKAYTDQVPTLFLRFLQKLVLNRRQMLIPDIATEYDALLDEAEGRVHADITVSKPVNDSDLSNIVDSLSKSLGKTVVPNVIVNSAILGGVVVKVGETIMDGSVRRRLSRLARSMQATS